MTKKVTIMRLKVDLQCEKCYMKVKKLLSKIPQIRDQLYNENENTVTIKVVCCSPEKVRDKLCYQGGGSIKSIEIVVPPKPEKPKAEPEKPKEPEKPTLQQNTVTALPPTTTPVVKLHDPAPVLVAAYRSPTDSVGLFYGSPRGFYGRPIYDSYGGSGPCYLGYQHLCEEDLPDSECTIT